MLALKPWGLSFRDLLEVSLLAASSLLVGACAEPISAQECLRLLEHYTDKQIDQARPSTRPGERERLIMESQARALSDPEFLSCESKVSRSQYECAMSAGTADAIERCLL